MTQSTQAASSAASAVADGAQTHQYLTFMLGGELFAIGILCIKEIIEYASLTEVPMMPAAVRGVINLRGAVVPVTDLLIRFGKKSSPVSKRTCIVIIEVTGLGERQDIGIVVDSVDSVLDIPPRRLSRRRPSVPASARISSGEWARSTESSSSCWMSITRWPWKKWRRWRTARRKAPSRPPE